MLGGYVRQKAVNHGMSFWNGCKAKEDPQMLLSAEHAAMFCPVGSNRQLRISACDTLELGLSFDSETDDDVPSGHQTS